MIPLEISDNLEAWRALNTKWEGRVPCMYVDVKGLVTVGVGNMLPSPAHACRLPFRRPDGSLASADEVTAAWHRVKNCGQGHRFWKSYAPALTDLRLDDHAIDGLVQDMLFAQERYLVDHFVPVEEWRTWPCDAQFVALSLCWALGAGWPRKRPDLWGNFRRREWLAARAICGLKEQGNPGVAPRNAANRAMLANAAVVDARGLDLDTLFWPRELPPVADTVPDIQPAVSAPRPVPVQWVLDAGVDWEQIRKDHNEKLY